MTLLGTLLSLATALEGGVSLLVIFLLIRRIDALKAEIAQGNGEFSSEVEESDSEWWG